MDKTMMGTGSLDRQARGGARAAGGALTAASSRAGKAARARRAIGLANNLGNGSPAGSASAPWAPQPGMTQSGPHGQLWSFPAGTFAPASAPLPEHRTAGGNDAPSAAKAAIAVSASMLCSANA